jgi:hypothetical protein
MLAGLFKPKPKEYPQLRNCMLALAGKIPPNWRVVDPATESPTIIVENKIFIDVIRINSDILKFEISFRQRDGLYKLSDKVKYTHIFIGYRSGLTEIWATAFFIFPYPHHEEKLVEALKELVQVYQELKQN